MLAVMHSILVHSLQDLTIPTMALAAAEFSITAKLITVTANAGQTKAYGSADPTPFTYTLVPGLEGTDIISGLMARASGEDVGSYAFNHGTLTAGPTIPYQWHWQQLSSASQRS